MLGKLMTIATLGVAAISAFYVGYKTVNVSMQSKKSQLLKNEKEKKKKCQVKVDELLIKDRIDHFHKTWDDYKLTDKEYERYFPKLDMQRAIPLWNQPYPGLFDMFGLIDGNFPFKDIHIPDEAEFVLKQLISVNIIRKGDDLTVNFTVNKTFLNDDYFPAISDVIYARLDKLAKTVRDWMRYARKGKVSVEQPVTGLYGGNIFAFINVHIKDHYEVLRTSLRSHTEWEHISFD